MPIRVLHRRSFRERKLGSNAEKMAPGGQTYRCPSYDSIPKGKTEAENEHTCAGSTMLNAPSEKCGMEHVQNARRKTQNAVTALREPKLPKHNPRIGFTKLLCRMGRLFMHQSLKAGATEQQRRGRRLPLLLLCTMIREESTMPRREINRHTGYTDLGGSQWVRANRTIALSPARPNIESLRPMARSCPCPEAKN